MSDSSYFPRWRQSLAASLHRGRSKPQAKYFQFANVGLDGFAQNRTLVFRGFGENSNELLAITDRRSEKYKECSAHPFAQIAWYFETSREQYRISCELNLLDVHAVKQKLRKRIWSQLSENAKAQFYWPDPLDTFNASEENLFNIKVSDIEEKTPAKNFVVIKLSATYVDYLDLKTSPQTREVYKLSIGSAKLSNALSQDDKHRPQWDWSRVNP